MQKEQMLASVVFLMILFISESYHYTALHQVSECCVNSNHSSFCLYCPGTIAISGILAYNKASGYGGRCMGVRIISLIIMGLSLIFLLVTLCNRTYRKYYLPVKMVCSLEFLLFSFTMGLLYGQLLQTLKLLPGLLLCLIGDLFMGMRHKSQKNTCFLLGTMAFALAHISFLVMLLISYPFQWADLTVVIVMPIVIKLLKKTGQFRFVKYEGMAILYSILVAGFAWKSAEIAIGTMQSADICLAAGAVCFFLSDSLIFLISFWKKRLWPLHGMEISAYYIAMCLIGLSISLR